MNDTTPVNLDDYADALRESGQNIDRALQELERVSADTWADSFADLLDGLSRTLLKRYAAVCNGDIVQAEGGGEG